MDRVPARLDAGQEQELLLDIRGQQQQVHDLRDPGTGDVAEPGQFGVVGDLAGPDQLARSGSPAPSAGRCGAPDRAAAEAPGARPCDISFRLPRPRRRKWIVDSTVMGLVMLRPPYSGWPIVGQRPDPVRVKCDRHLAVGPVVVDPLDQQLDDAGLLARRERFPHRIEDRHRLGDLALVNHLATQRDDLFANLGGTAFRDANPLLEVGQPGRGRRVAVAGSDLVEQLPDLGIPLPSSRSRPRRSASNSAIRDWPWLRAWAMVSCQ